MRFVVMVELDIELGKSGEQPTLWHAIKYAETGLQFHRVSNPNEAGGAIKGVRAEVLSVTKIGATRDSANIANDVLGMAEA